MAKKQKEAKSTTDDKRINVNRATEEKKSRDENKKIIDGIIFLACGICLILISVIFHTAHIFVTQNETVLFLNELFVQVLSHFGIGLLAIGVLSFILDMPHWTHYFEERLSKIVTDKKYLENLKPDDLITLQTEVLKVFFKNDEIGGTDGFLKYYQKNIQSIMGMAFRINVNMNLEVIEENDNDELEIVETLAYTCMPNSNKIQSNVCYLPEKGEHKHTKEFKVVLQHEELKHYDEADEDGNIIFNFSELKKLNINQNIASGFNLDIQKYNIEGLNVVVKAHYFVEKHRFFGWRMSHPTRNLTISLRHPKNLKLVKEHFFNAHDSVSEDVDEKMGLYFLKINDWLMPDEGITLQILPIDEADITQPPDILTPDSASPPEKQNKEVDLLVPSENGLGGQGDLSPNTPAS